MDQPASVAILENMWIQYGALGLLIAFLVLCVIFLYRLLKKSLNDFKEERVAKDKSHREEWAKHKAEQKAERELFDKKSEERSNLFIKTVTDNALSFARVLEGAVKENTQFLAENRAILESCKRK